VSGAGSAAADTPPLWLLAELTYACPLQCPYCSNPVNFARRGRELDTDEWLRVLRQGRALGAAQLGFSGGEPLVRRDLEQLIREARRLGYYTNLITSAVGMDADRVAALREAGLDHVQISFQAGAAAANDAIAGSAVFEHKRAMARAVKAAGFPLVLCFVLHRDNLEQVGDMLRLAVELEADYVELATVQYYGWALLNRERLLPSCDQLARAELAVEVHRRRFPDSPKVFYVVPDYHEGRPKACMNGWGRVFLAVAPDGTALPCHAAAELPLTFPNVRERDLEWIWRHSPAFNRFRGEGWMREPCRSCPQRTKDHGGCRCQAYLLTGEAENADPACSLAPHHGVVEAAVAAAHAGPASAPVYRNVRNSLRRVARKSGPS